MAVPSITEYQNLRKEVFVRPDVRDQFGHGTPLLDCIEAGSEVTNAVDITATHEGEYMVSVLRTAAPVNQAVPTGHGKQFPEPSSSLTGRALWKMKRHSSSLGQEGWNALVTSGGAKSVVDVLDMEMNSIVSAAQKQMSRYLHSDGTGLLATVASPNSWVNSTKLLTLVSATPLVGYERSEIIFRLTQTSPSTGTLGQGTLPTDWKTSGGDPWPAKITTSGVDTTNSKINLTWYDGSAFLDSGGAAFAATDFDQQSSVPMGVYQYDGQGQAIWGLANCCGTTNPSASGFNPSSPLTQLTTTALQVDGLFGGINRAAAGTDYWKGTSQVCTALTSGSSTTPSVEDHIYPFLSLLYARTQGDIDMLLGFTGFQVFNALRRDLTKLNMTHFETEVLGRPTEGYAPRQAYRAIQIENLYIIRDTDADPSKLRVIEPLSMFRVVGEEWHFDDTTGSMWNRQVGGLSRGKDEFVAYMFTTQQLMVDRLGPFGEITGFNATL